MIQRDPTASIQFGIRRNQNVAHRIARYPKDASLFHTEKFKLSDSVFLLSTLTCLGTISLLNSGFVTTYCKGSNENEKEQFEQEWDNFMIQSMSPGDDDDDDDEEDDDDHNDDEDEEDTESSINYDREREHNDSNHNDDGEEHEGGDNIHEQITENEDIDSNMKNFETDPYENLPEEDDPTTCTICLINRQGPCRPLWRKFEKCMKDNTPGPDEGSDEATSPSLSEKCDKYMLPWITCLQKFRNRYTLISNAFFQDEMIKEIENGVEEGEKILLDNFNLSSIVQISDEWNKKGEDKEIQDDEDIPLVEGVVSINLWDIQESRPIEIAFVKDQDGNLLGYEQFYDFKKSLNGNQDPDENNAGKVGGCIFHASPETTKSIQIFALYRNHNDESQRESDARVNHQVLKENIDDKDQMEECISKRKQTLFYSELLPMEEIPIQGKVSGEFMDNGESAEDSNTDMKEHSEGAKE